MMTGYRTLIFSLLVAIGGVLQAFDWVTVLPQDKTWSGIIMVALGAIIAGMRSFTTTPVGQSK